jgi:tetratricopeptide (TPR) repeat protein
MNLGRTKMVLEDYPGAKCEFDQAIEGNFNNANAYLERGKANFFMANHNISMTDLNKALRIDPELAEAYIFRGRTKAKLEDFVGANMDFASALGCKDGNEAYFYRAEMEGLRQNYAESINDFTKAIENDSQNAEAWYLRAITQGVYKNYTAVILDCSKAIEIEPDYYNALIARGQAKSHLEDERGAIADFDKAIEIDHENSIAYYNRAKSRGSLKDFLGCIEDCSMAIQLNPSFAEAYLFRGLAKVSSNQVQSGCLDFSKAGELGLEESYKAIKEYCK